MKTETLGRIRIPRNHDDDYTEESAAARRAFVKENTGTTLSHVGHYSLDPAILPGNIEHFTGVAQVPIGIAGPLRIEGEHARGDFYVPLATTEGTLISSYNRGMRLLTQCGGVKTTVLDDAMQRAPVFMLGDALQSRNFGEWIEEHIDEIRHTAELTTHVGKLRNIQQFAVGPLRYLRFNSPPAMQPDRTWRARRRLLPVNGSRAFTPCTRSISSREIRIPTRSIRS